MLLALSKNFGLCMKSSRERKTTKKTTDPLRDTYGLSDEKRLEIKHEKVTSENFANLDRTKTCDNIIRQLSDPATLERHVITGEKCDRVSDVRLLNTSILGTKNAMQRFQNLSTEETLDVKKSIDIVIQLQRLSDDNTEARKNILIAFANLVTTQARYLDTFSKIFTTHHNKKLQCVYF